MYTFEEDMSKIVLFILFLLRPLETDVRSRCDSLAGNGSAALCIYDGWGGWSPLYLWLWPCWYKCYMEAYPDPLQLKRPNSSMYSSHQSASLDNQQQRIQQVEGHSRFQHYKRICFQKYIRMYLRSEQYLDFEYSQAPIQIYSYLQLWNNDFPVGQSSSSRTS